MSQFDQFVRSYLRQIPRANKVGKEFQGDIASRNAPRSD
jgi:hypothetical protein